MVSSFKYDKTKLKSKILDEGIEVYSKRKGTIAFYSYDEISHILVLNISPISYPKLILKNQNTIGIYASPSRWLLRQISDKNIDIPIEYEEGIEWIREEYEKGTKL